MTPKIGPVVARAIRDGSLSKKDAGAAALARRYALLIDEAADLADQLALVDVDPDDEKSYQRLRKLQAAVEAHQVASDLGPKLLAALTALGLTPAGRGAKGGESGAGIAARLDEFTKARARKHAS